MERPVERRPRWLGVLLRLGVSLALLAYVLAQTNWGNVLGLLKGLDVFWLAVMMLTAPMNVGVCVWKWRLLLASQGHRVPFRTLFGMYVLGQFYGNVLPSSVGGDVARVAVLSRRIQAPKDALGSIVVERFTGFSVLILLAIMAIVTVPAFRRNLPLLAMVLVAVALYAGLLVGILSTRVVWLLRLVGGRCRWLTPLIDKVERFQISLRHFGRHPRVLLGAVALSLAFYAGSILTVYAACRGVGQAVPIAKLAAAVPVVLAVTLVPVTAGGVGLAEWSYRDSFAALAILPDLGLTVSLLLRIRGLIWSSSGYLIYTLATLGLGRSTASPNTWPDRAACKES
ncbi:MAG TPA: lysylphosphatidylglycerol synthase transmembrane domain-containing protein [Phycisphaeraceae bacterium]